MGTDDYASAYMAAEAAYNAGDFEPLRNLLADDFVTSDGKTADEFVAGLRDTIRSFTTAGLTGYGPFLLDYGVGAAKDGTTYRAAGILRFNAAGKAVAFTALGDA